MIQDLILDAIHHNVVDHKLGHVNFPFLVMENRDGWWPSPIYLLMEATIMNEHQPYSMLTGYKTLNISGSYANKNTTYISHNT